MEKLRAEIANLEKQKSQVKVAETRVVQTEPVKPKSVNEASTQAFETAGIKIAQESVNNKGDKVTPR
jgi:hypothetical protein